MDYNLLICASDKGWTAIDVNLGGGCDRISIEGNDVLQISSDEALDYFCGQILNYYNIEKFNDINLNIKIVVIGKYSDLISKIFVRMQDARNVNIIDAENIIPIYVLKKCIVKKGGIIDVNCMDSTYTLQVDKNYTISYVPDKVGEEITMKPEDFSMLFQFDCKNLISDESELRKLKSEYKRDIEEKQKEIVKQEKRYADLLKVKEQLEQANAELNKKIKTNNTKFNDKRIIVHFTEKELEDTECSSSSYVSTLLSFAIGSSDPRIKASREVKYTCKLLKKEGDIVKKGTPVLEIKEFCKFMKADFEETGRTCIIKSCKEGRVFYLVQDNDSVKEGADVLIISDIADKRSDVMKWYKEMK